MSNNVSGGILIDTKQAESWTKTWKKSWIILQLNSFPLLVVRAISIVHVERFVVFSCNWIYHEDIYKLDTWEREKKTSNERGIKQTFIVNRRFARNCIDACQSCRRVRLHHNCDSLSRSFSRRFSSRSRLSSSCLAEIHLFSHPVNPLTPHAVSSSFEREADIATVKFHVISRSTLVNVFQFHFLSLIHLGILCALFD